MSLQATHEVKDQVRRAIDIVDLVGDYIPLRRDGRAYKGLCPWHDDTRPSLQVNPERQSFKCWVCDLGGDIFSFIMKMEGVSFPEALSMLADRAGIPLTQTHRSPASKQAEDEKQLLYQAMGWAERQYHECLLHSPEGEPGRRYLESRNVSLDSIKRFHLGFAPDRRNWLQDRARRDGISAKALETVDVIGRSAEYGGVFERFRGRVLFAIRDAQGRPVGLGGRVLPESATTSPAKYVNTRETPLFAKHQLLYGLDLAREAISRSRTVLVMEGYTDCIAAHEHGLTNTVAVMGTALGERHLQLLRRYADRVVLILDGDTAGQKRTNEILDLFLAHEVDLHILTLPEGLDPCDFLSQRGTDEFQTLLDQSVDALEHKFRVATANLGPDSGTHAVVQAVEEVLTSLAKVPHWKSRSSGATSLKEVEILHRLARRTTDPRSNLAMVEDALRGRLKELRNGTQRNRRLAPTQTPASSSAAEFQLNEWETELLEIVLLRPESVTELRLTTALDELQSPLARRVMDKCCELADAGESPAFERLMLEFDEPEIKSRLVELDERGREKASADIALRLRTWLHAVERRRLRTRTRELAASSAEGALDADQQLEALGKLIEAERKRQSISAPTDG